MDPSQPSPVEDPTVAAGDVAVDADVDALAWSGDGLLPVVVQDADSLDVLMLAWMDAEALRRTVRTGAATYWSRSRKEYWVKGATSGNTQDVVEIRYDCDADALLLVVHQHGVACHTGTRSCFARLVGAGPDQPRTDPPHTDPDGSL
jgi:phosphoribosyl-AMP cyclohydrolase